MLLEEIEDEFLVRLPRRKFRDVKTVGDVHARVIRILKKRETPNEEVVWARLIEILSEETGRDMENISAGDRLDEMGVPKLVVERVEGLKRWLTGRKGPEQKAKAESQKPKDKKSN